MLFDSIAYILFLPLVLLAYFGLPQRWRWMLLLVSSYFFYGYWKVEYLGLILLSTTVDFFAAQQIAKTTALNRKRLWLTLSLISNLGILFFFKYSGWFLQDVLVPAIPSTNGLVDDILRQWSFILPVGISFYTFQTMGYTIDVYKGRAKPETNYGKFALFVSYFPQLVAGPIERFSRLQPQLTAPHRFTYQNLKMGGRLILYGLFIKMCIADNLAPLVDTVYGDPSAFDSWSLIWSTLLFGLQIYSDFHGYSLIAIGTAQLFGVSLMNNFRSPYLSLSIREFWSRWHISLSSWFRDYLYIPLGGSKVGKARWALNIFTVFAVSGLWHGASWTFVIWGAIHGVAYLAEHYTIGRVGSKSKGLKLLKWALTACVVFIAWVFFRADSLDAAMAVIKGFGQSAGELHLETDYIASAMLGLFLISDIALRNSRFDTWMEHRSWPIRWTLYAGMLYAITALSGTTNHPFIYFQF